MAILNSYKKKDLRAYYKSLRASLSKEQTRKMDQAILEQFRKIPIQNGGLKSALVYMPMHHINEVDTDLFIKYLQKEIQPAIQVAFPRTNFKTLDMEAILTKETGSFRENSLRLAEPVHGRLLAPQKVDIVLLPLLIFDKKGNRVGYGKGFYDRFLARCRPEVLKIGLSYLPPVPQIEDVGNFDIPLDYCATPDRLYDFK